MSGLTVTFILCVLCYVGALKRSLYELLCHMTIVFTSYF